MVGARSDGGIVEFVNLTNTLETEDIKTVFIFCFHRIHHFPIDRRYTCNIPISVFEHTSNFEIQIRRRLTFD